MQIDKAILATTAAEAKTAVTNNVADLKQRVQWIRAIDKAYRFLASGQVEMKSVTSTLGYEVTMKSPNSGAVYQVGAKRCTCAAGQALEKCWHRTALQIWKRMMEKQARRLGN